MSIANERNLACGGKNLTISKSIADGVEAEIFSDMPLEAKEFLIKFHNGVDTNKDLMSQLKLVHKVICLI